MSENDTMRQAMEKMEYHNHTAIPTIDAQGKYVRILTEGDLLWKMKNTPNLTFWETSSVYLRDVPSRRASHGVYINATMEDLVELAMNQNFVPVTDDAGIFIGIVTRKAILSYLRADNLSLHDRMKSIESADKREM